MSPEVSCVPFHAIEGLLDAALSLGSGSGATKGIKCPSNVGEIGSIFS